MKIAFLSAANNVHTMRWANAMQERGHKVTVISCKNHAPDEKINYAEGIEVVLLKLSAPLCYYLCAAQLKRIIKKGRFDVVNIHYASGYGTLGRKAKLKNALLNIWGSDVYVFPYKSSFNKRTIIKNLKYYKYVASTSNCMAKQAARFAERDYFITPFGVDVEKFRPIGGLKPKDKIIFGTVKTLSPVYRIDDTVKAFSALIRKLSEEGRDDLINKLTYEIYGKGEQREELQSLIDNLGLSDKVKLCGYVQNGNLPQVLNTFTVFNCNSISESFGVAAVEAMACGIPVQVSDADGFAEVVEDGVTGLIAPRGDIDAISSNMYTLLTDGEKRSEMSAACVERVKKFYDWEKCVDIMENLYKGVI